MTNKDTQTFAGQMVAQTMLIQVLTEQMVESASDQGAAARRKVALCIRAIRSNPDMTGAEKQGAVKTFEDALDRFDRIADAARGG